MVRLFDRDYKLDHPDSDIFLSQASLFSEQEEIKIHQEKDGSLTINVPLGGSISVTQDNNNFQHICIKNPLRVCNCSQGCADDDFEPTVYEGE